MQTTCKTIVYYELKCTGHNTKEGRPFFPLCCTAALTHSALVLIELADPELEQLTCEEVQVLFECCACTY